MTSAILILSGIACLTLSCWMIYKLRPQEGRPPSIWTKTEMRATSFAMAQFVLLIAGIGMVAKGIF